MSNLPVMESNVESTATVESNAVESTTTLEDRTLATRYVMQHAASVDDGRKTLRALGIKTSYNESVMIFSTMQTQKSNIDTTYAQECNGLILEQGTWRPLVVPPRSLRNNISTEISNTFVHQGLYHIYQVEDGTCFNLYYYNNRWVISTAKGHTMNDVKWDDKSYQEIISECLSNIGFSWESFTQLLDQKQCFTFGFKHPSFHKFFAGANPLYKMWFIQSVVTDESSDRYLWASDQSPIAIIPTQEYFTNVVGSLRDLYKRASNSLAEYLTKGSTCYGFILRSVNTKATTVHSDLIIESSLMREIRKFWYENSTVELCHANGWNKEKAVTLRAFLDVEHYETFKILFPQYNHLSETYTKLVNLVIDDMVSLATKTNVETSVGNSVENNVDSNKKCASLLLTAFNETSKYYIKNESTARIRKAFLDFVRHPSSLEFLYPMLV